MKYSVPQSYVQAPRVVNQFAYSLRVAPFQKQDIWLEDRAMARLVEISAREFESRTFESSRPLVSYVHSEALRTYRVQMRIMQQLATIVESDVDLFLLEDLKGDKLPAQLGTTYAPALIFQKERVLYVI